MINICIIHYNTPELTECLIKSINKNTPNCHIYIFDNSDKAPFTYKQKNITIFDNTKGQIVNFNEWLKKFPKKGGEASGKYVSSKHCISVDKCFDLINDNFILMDSDILLKQDISCFWNNNYAYVGESIFQPYTKIKRLLPFICFINVNMCKQNGVRYFDEKHMHGLNYGLEGNKYDTGASFYLNTNKLPKKEISIGDYIIHYKGGSWDYSHKSNKKIHGDLKPMEWAYVNKSLWETKPSKNVIYTCITGGYETIANPSVIVDGFDYVCFTDNQNASSSIWKIKPIPDELKHLTTVKQQRCIKVCPHKYLPEYDLSVWVDGAVDILGNINEFINNECSDGTKSVFIPTHPSRSCIYDEMIACAKIRKDKLENMQPQIDRYKQEGFPAKFGLVQSNIVIRRHNNSYCKKLMNLWEKEIINGSHRDQLSFNYCLWKIGSYGFKYLDKRTCNSKYFKWYSNHKRPSAANPKILAPTTIVSKQSIPTINKTNTFNTENLNKIKMASQKRKMYTTRAAVARKKISLSGYF